MSQSPAGHLGSSRAALLRAKTAKSLRSARFGLPIAVSIVSSMLSSGLLALECSFSLCVLRCSKWSGLFDVRCSICSRIQYLYMFSRHLVSIKYGDVAQLVERPLSMREVRGSKPRISKISFYFFFVAGRQLENIQANTIFAKSKRPSYNSTKHPARVCVR